jgi:hypothetical protein
MRKWDASQLDRLTYDITQLKNKFQHTNRSYCINIRAYAILIDRVHFKWETFGMEVKAADELGLI